MNHNTGLVLIALVMMAPAVFPAVVILLDVFLNSKTTEEKLRKTG